MTPPVNSKAIIVLGVHRSGTSALAGALAMLGFHPGSTLLPAVEGVNNNGFFEDQRVVDLNDELLQRLDRDWRWPTPMPADWLTRTDLTDLRARARALLVEQATHNTWLLKDPRLCQLLPLWLEEMSALSITPSILLTHRDVSEVSQSLLKRDNMPTALAEALWLEHLLSAERCTRDLPRRLVHYSNLLAQPKQTLEGIIAWLDLAPTDEQLSHAAASISTSQQHHKATQLSASQLPLAGELNQLLADSATAATSLDALNSKNLSATFDKITNRFSESSSLMEPVVEAQEQSIQQMERHLAEAIAQVEANTKATEAYAENAALSADAARQQYRELTKAVQQIESQTGEIAQLRAELAKSQADHLKFRDRATRVLGDQVLPPAQSSKREQTTNDYKGLINLRVENNSHTRVVRYLREEFLAEPAKVLEIGCSEGYFGAALKEDGHEVWGIETNAIAADAADAVLDKVYRDSIEAFLLSEEFLDDRFDAIVFGDVLEHLLDPVRVLREVSERLTERGVIVTSVPNVAHERVRMMLLEGRWEYSATGIMDNTHLHFFTRDTLIDMFSAASLKVERLSAINLDGPAVQIPVSPRTEALAKTLITDRESDIFQFITLVRPNLSAEETQAGNAAFKLSQQQNILCLPPAPDSSLYTIRLGDPLERYTQLFGGEVRIAPFGTPTEADIDWADSVLLQREVNEQQLELVAQLKARGKRVIFDIDDYLLEAPEYLSVHEHCKAMRPMLETMLGTVDAVSASTKPLQDKLGVHSANVFLTPNCAWSSHPPIRHFATEHTSALDAQPVRIIVASSDSVRVDFLVDALRQLVAQENIELVGIGPPGDFLREAGLPIETAALMPHDQFKAYAASRDNTIALIPLDANEFNRCKSAIKYFDYALAGVPCVCSGVEPYTTAVVGNITGILCPDDTNEWVKSVSNLIHNVVLRNNIADAARAQVLEQHNLNLTAAAWHELFKATRFVGDDPLYPKDDTPTEDVNIELTNPDSSPPPPERQQPERRTNGQLALGTLRHAVNPASWQSAWQIYKKEGLRGLRAKWKLVF